MPAESENPLTPAEVLLNKARQDYHLANLVVGDISVMDEHIGFLTQQAVEKSLKVVLIVHQVYYRRTHDLIELMDCLDDANVKIPPELASASYLTPFAVEMRYDFLPPEKDESFNRNQAVMLAKKAVEWASQFLKN